MKCFDSESNVFWKESCKDRNVYFKSKIYIETGSNHLNNTPQHSMIRIKYSHKNKIYEAYSRANDTIIFPFYDEHLVDEFIFPHESIGIKLIQDDSNSSEEDTHQELFQRLKSPGKYQTIINC